MQYYCAVQKCKSMQILWHVVDVSASKAAICTRASDFHTLAAPLQNFQIRTARSCLSGQFDVVFIQHIPCCQYEWGHSYQLVQWPACSRPTKPAAWRSWRKSDFPVKGRVPCTLLQSQLLIWPSESSILNQVQESRPLSELCRRAQTFDCCIWALTAAKYNRTRRTVRTSWTCCSYIMDVLLVHVRLAM